MTDTITQNDTEYVEIGSVCLERDSLVIEPFENERGGAGRLDYGCFADDYLVRDHGQDTHPGKVADARGRAETFCDGVDEEYLWLVPASSVEEASIELEEYLRLRNVEWDDE